MGLVAQIGNHAVKSGSTLQSLTALSVGGAEFYAVVKGGQVGLSLRSKYMQLDFKFLDVSVGRRTTNETHSYPILLGTRTTSRWRSQYQEGAYSEKLCRCWNDASLGFLYHNNNVSLQDWYCTDHGSLTLLQDVPGIAQLLKGADVGGAEQTLVVTGCDHRDGCKS